MSYQGQVIAQSFTWQRKMLDELARLKASGERPTFVALGHALGINEATARRCVLWLQHEGFATVTPVSGVRTDIELTRNPGDDELKAAIANRGAGT